MPSLKTNTFRVHATEQLRESLFEPAGTQYYAFAGRPDPWTNDSTPPVPVDASQETVFETYDTMLFGKVVGPTDVAMMVPKHLWTANTVYAMYDDKVPLYNSNFFVAVDATTAFHVFKCLNNNGGAPSTVFPDRNTTSEDDEYYSTSDGYQWKYLYSFSNSSHKKFATNQWIPVFPNANVTSNAVSGAIDVIVVDNPGTRYNSYSNGFFTEIAVAGDTTVYGIDPISSANTDFYKNCALKIVNGQGSGQQRRIAEYSVQGGFKRVYLTQPFEELPTTSSRYEITPHVSVVGDGANCVARAIIDPVSNTVNTIEITSRGSGYSYAVAEVIGNTGIIVNGSTVIQANNAVLRPIMGPIGGHGSDINNELGAVALGFSVTFANTEQLTIPIDGRYRQIGLMKDPLFANVELTIANTQGVFVDEEIVFVANTDISGEVTFYSEPSAVLRLTNVRAGFAAPQLVRGATSNATAIVESIRVGSSEKTFTTFDQRVRLDTTFNGTSPFEPGQAVRQQITDAQAVVHASNTSFTAVTQVRGTLNINNVDSSQYLTSDTAVANVNAIVAGDLVRASGEILYVENVQPVTRGGSLSETIKFIIRF